MKDYKAIKPQNLPARAPVFSTLTTVLALDHWNAPDWLWGSLGLLFLSIWIFFIVAKAHEQTVDIFKNRKKKPSNTFEERLNEQRGSL